MTLASLIEDLKTHIQDEYAPGAWEDVPKEIFLDYKEKYAKKKEVPPEKPAPVPIPVKKPVKVDENPYRSFFQKCYPQVKLVDQPQQRTEITETIFLCEHGEDEWERFFDKISKAIRDRGRKASVLEANTWETSTPGHLLVGREEILKKFEGQASIPLPNDLKACQENANKRKLWSTLCHLLKL